MSLTNAEMMRRYRGRRLIAKSAARIHALAGLARSAIAAGDSGEAARYTRDAITEAKYAEWVRAKLLHAPMIPGPWMGKVDWTDFTRNRPPYL